MKKQIPVLWLFSILVLCHILHPNPPPKVAKVESCDVTTVGYCFNSCDVTNRGLWLKGRMEGGSVADKKLLENKEGIFMQIFTQKAWVGLSVDELSVEALSLVPIAPSLCGLIVWLVDIAQVWTCVEVPCWPAGFWVGFGFYSWGWCWIELFREGVHRGAWEPGVRLTQMCRASGPRAGWCATTSVQAKGLFSGKSEHAAHLLLGTGLGLPWELFSWPMIRDLKTPAAENPKLS